MRAKLSTNAFVRVETIIGAPIRSNQWNAEYLITPDMFKSILAQEPSQRPVRPSKAMLWRDIIKAGEFVTTPQGIMIDTEGYMINGQHRGIGCIEANIPIRVMVFFNRPRSEFKVYDRGIARTVGDDLVMLGESDVGEANVLQAAGRLLFHHDAGRFPWMPYPLLSVDKVIAVMDRHPKLRDTVSYFYHNRGSGRGMPTAPAAAFFTLFCEVSEEQGRMFMDQCHTGNHIGAGFPAKLLRESLERDRTRKHSDARNAFMVRLVHAWNAFYDERSVDTLYSVPLKGKFPKISGYRPPK